MKSVRGSDKWSRLPATQSAAADWRAALAGRSQTGEVDCFDSQRRFLFFSFFNTGLFFPSLSLSVFRLSSITVKKPSKD